MKNKINKEERVRLVFETISKISGFEIKPNKDFYVIGNGIKGVYTIDESLLLLCKKSNGRYEVSDYGILPILKGGYQLDEIKEPLLTDKEPLLTDKERGFLRHFIFKELSIEEEPQSTLMYMYDRNNIIVNVIELYDTNFSFDGLEKGKRYSREELEL